MNKVRKGFAQILLLVTVVIIGIGLLGYFAYKNNQVYFQSQQNAGKNLSSTTPAKENIPTTVPSDRNSANPKPTDSTLYNSFDIPTTQIPYPNGWPQDLHYPQQLKLVYARGSTEAGWESALTFVGTAKEASDILENFFTKNGWTVTDRTVQDENNFGLFIGRNNKEGFIIIGSDPSSKTVKMTITVYE